MTRDERNRVKKVKLATNPKTTPSGRDLPLFLPPMDEERIIGKTGKMHGESIVTIPAIKEKTTSNSIFVRYQAQGSKVQVITFLL